MTREVSRRNSGDKGGIKPDTVGERDLDARHVADRPDIFERPRSKLSINFGKGAK